MGKFVSGTFQKFLIVGIFFIFTGCTSITVPEYIQDKNPYKHKFYASFDNVLEASVQVLEESGWKVAKESDPAVFERSQSGIDSNQSILLFSKVRQNALFLGTRYARINVYLRSSENQDITEVEIRYITINSTLLKTFENYNHDHAVSRLFSKIEGRLSQ